VLRVTRRDTGALFCLLGASSRGPSAQPAHSREMMFPPARPRRRDDPRRRIGRPDDGVTPAHASNDFSRRLSWPARKSQPSAALMRRLRCVLSRPASASLYSAIARHSVDGMRAHLCARCVQVCAPEGGCTHGGAHMSVLRFCRSRWMRMPYPGRHVAQRHLGSPALAHGVRTCARRGVRTEGCVQALFA
jgi:hypothetical protein